jgi:hypothetical protein
MCKELILFLIVSDRGTASAANMRLTRRVCLQHKGIESKKKLCGAVSRIMR